MPANPEIKLMRIPVKDVVCHDCKCELPFGTWAHYLTGTTLAICLPCGAKKGWTDKERATHIVKVRELKEDIKALRKLKMAEADALFLVREKVDIHRFGERYIELDLLIHRSLAKVQEYLDKVATSEERKMFRELYSIITEIRETQKVIQKEMEERLFLVERSENKKKHIQKMIRTEEEDQRLLEETEETAIPMVQQE